MWKRVKDNLESGIEKVKWFSSLLNERMKIELSVFKLLHQSAEIEKKREALLKTIGEKVSQLKNATDKQILRDPVILDAMKAVEELDAEIADLRRKAAEIGKTDE